ncbi:MAG: hypothetical protein KIT80_21535 [Chitinophagaceae bacterium]|nr:hypothetical protein [Chitinophagaceae bacterium]MCW5929517.1 hypothetical protein [Chitinophagaceae bacterium]
MINRIPVKAFYRALATIAFSFTFFITHPQVLTSEDSLQAGLITREQATVISGYGEALTAKNKVKAVTASERNALVKFLESL